MIYVVLSDFWWNWAKKKGYLKGKLGIKYVKSRKLGRLWVIKETLKEKLTRFLSNG